MKRIIYAMLISLGIANAAFGLSLEEKFVVGLQAQGFSIIEKGYTIFGRLRILAENGTFRREIVINRNTGEILRDYSVLLANSPTVNVGPIVADSTSHRSSENKGTRGATKGKSAVVSTIVSDNELVFDPSTGNEPNVDLEGSALEIGGNVGGDGAENEIVVIPPPMELNDFDQND